MLLRYRNPFRTFVDEFLGEDYLPEESKKSQTGISTPAVNVIEGKDNFKIEVAAPGLDKKDFNIDLDQDVLTISSEKETEDKEEKDQYMRREFCYSTFCRSFTLPESADADNISAKHKDGILTISIPKKEEAKEKPPRKIDIS